MIVTIYNNAQFQGESQQLPIGRYDIDILRTGIGNDSLGSLQIPDGVQVRLFKDSGFKKPLSTFQNDASTLGANDRGTSSVIVELRPDYFYCIKAEHSKKVLELSGQSQDENAAVLQQEFNGTKQQQQFEFIALEEGYYKIIARHSQKVLSSEGGATGNYTKIVQQDWKDEDYQKWALEWQEDGTFKIRNKKSSTAVIDISRGKTDNGTTVHLYGWHGKNNQRFRIERVVQAKPASTFFPESEETHYRIFTKRNKPFGIEANSLLANARVVQQTLDHGKNGQRFQFIELGVGLYKIKNLNSGKYLSIKSGADQNGAFVTQEDWQDEPSQKWRLSLLEDGYFRIIAQHNQKNLDLAAGSDRDGTAIQQWSRNNNLINQTFRLEPQSMLPTLRITPPAAACAPAIVDLRDKAITAGSDQGQLDYFKDEELQQPLPNPEAAEAGTYYIRLTTPDGRTASGSVTVAVHPLPQLAITNPAPVCWDHKIDLTAAAITAGRDAGQLAYFKDQALSQALTKPEAVDAGTYYIRLTTEQGCTIAKPVVATILPQPKLPIINPAAVCWDQKVDLTAEAITAGRDAGQLAYFKDQALSQALDNPQAVDPGDKYYIRLTTAQGCTIAKPVVATVHPKPKLPVVNPPAVCWDKKTDLTAAAITDGRNAGTLAFFLDAALTQPVPKPQAVDPGTYYIRLTAYNGCTIAQPVTATAHPKPKLVINAPKPVCGGTAFNLKAAAITQGSDPGDLFYFIDKDLTQSIDAPETVEAGTYYIQLKTENGCTVSEPVTFISHPIPELIVNKPAPVCNGFKFKLKTAVATQPASTDKLEYSTDEKSYSTLSEATEVRTGIFHIRLTNQFGCSTAASVEVTEYPVPKLKLIEEEWAYIPDKVDLTMPYLTAGSDEGTLSYFKNQALNQPLTSEQAMAVDAGEYYIQLTSPEGCKSEVKKIKAVLKPRPSIVVPIHVDARYIVEKTTCASPRLDFSRLPYYNGEMDINPYTPYLGEELEAVPFDNGAFELDKGVHLHWALPDFLTQSFRYPMLDLTALRRHTRVNRLGEKQDEKLCNHLIDIFTKEGWVRLIPENNAYATILAEREKVDITISEMLTNAAPEQRELGQEILRVRSLLEPGGTQMPPIPNRWQVIRTGGNEGGKHWIVESDFLQPAEQGNYQTGVPFPQPNPEPDKAPYGWLGRKYNKHEPKPAAGAGGYLGIPLSTLGYGDATFASFYPNCHSVFGLHDDTATPGKEYKYEIYGYYAPENRDYEYFDLQRKDLANRTEKTQLRQVLSDFLSERLKLPMEDKTPGVWPDRLTCCGQIKVVAKSSENTDSPDISVTVGSTSTEAVSAYLANHISKNKKLEVEEYLESLQYLSRLEHLQTDIGPKLREERHRQSFTSEKGGDRWVLVPRINAEGQTERPVEQTTLTEDKAHFLHELNELQLAFDRKDEKIKSLRRQIFVDWSKYMLCQYPPDGADDDYPDADQARFFIEHELMPWLEDMNAERQQLAKALRDHIQSFWHFLPGDIPSPAGLYQAMMEFPEIKPWLDLEPEAAGSAAALVRCLNRYIDQKGYQEEILSGDTDGPKLSIAEILEQQNYQNHLIKNRLELEANFPNHLPKHPDTILKRKPHRPFHRPADPVVLITGDTLKTTRKHGQDGMLPNKLSLIREKDDERLTDWRAIASNLIPPEWQAVPDRHPILLDWLVEFFPVEDTDFNLDAYEPNYLLNKYTLDLNAADLRATKDDLYSGVGQSFWGSALLATSGSKSLKQSLETFLIGELALTDADLEDIAKQREPFFQNDPWINKYPGKPVTPANFDAFYGWTPDVITATELRELWASKHKGLALLAYEELNKTHFLSQALGGFTPALLMLREGYQLRIADPLGYPEYQEFSRRANEAVGLLNHTSALPNNPFFPIRAGAATLLELRLLDTFGQEMVHLKDIPEVIAAETLQPQHSHHHFELNPRLSQAARLNFHWLSANDDMVEHNEHPASSPICGWVLLNYLDKSLMIYDQAGAALGYIDREGHWRSAPGQRPGVLAEGIPNWHLRRMVLWLMNKAKQEAGSAEGQTDTIPHFMTLVQDALRHVEPPRGDHAGEGVAMLMSRPLALVRATASLEIKGLPAVNQSWAQFREVIESPAGDRESTLDIENVALPLRIGEDHQLNDGLIGFWEDAADGEAYLDDSFRLPSLHRATDGSRDHTDEHQLDTLTAGVDGNRGKALTFNLLMDPHGSVHATCGILPVQELTLPKDIYYDALERMEVSFLTSPLLTPQEMIHVSLPDEPGFQWSWVEIDRREWREVSTIGHFRKQDLVAVFGGVGETLWEQLLDRGWIILDGDQAAIVPPGRRPATENFPPENLAPQLEHFLASRQIQPFQLTPTGKTGQEIREGWLKLRPMPELPSNIEE